MILPLKNMATNPNIMKTTMQASRIPPIMVKSTLVCKANIVRARQTAAVIPTAMRTCTKGERMNINQVINSINSGTLTSVGAWRDAVTPRRNDWAAVNIPKKMKLVGNVRRTPSQQAMHIIVTNSTPRATHTSHPFRCAKFFVPSW